MTLSTNKGKAILEHLNKEPKYKHKTWSQQLRAQSWSVWIKQLALWRTAIAGVTPAVCALALARLCLWHPCPQPLAFWPWLPPGAQTKPRTTSNFSVPALTWTPFLPWQALWGARQDQSQTGGDLVEYTAVISPSNKTSCLALMSSREGWRGSSLGRKAGPCWGPDGGQVSSTLFILNWARSVISS